VDDPWIRDEAAAAARLAAQGLTARDARTPEDVVGRLLAVQAQDLRAATLAIRSRSTGLRVADVHAALTERRTLVVDWLCRGTLHMVRAEDHAWLHALTAPRLRTGNRRRLAQEGVGPADAARGVRVLADAVGGGGAITRADARGLLEAAGVPTAGQALVHVLFAASLEGMLVRGPIVGTEQAYVDPATWIGPSAPLDRPGALARLGARYLAGHAPATPADLAAWAGITLGDARTALADAPAAATAGEASPGPLPAPRLLGGFDPVLHGWGSREWVVGPHAGVVTSNGVFRPTALVGGRVVATWSLPRGRVTLTPFAPIPADAMRALEADADDLRGYLGLPAGPPMRVPESPAG
jgi:hypothetical protein